MKQLLLSCMLSGIFINIFCQQALKPIPSLVHHSIGIEKSKKSYLSNSRLAYHFGFNGADNDESEFTQNIFSLYPISYSKHDWDTVWNHDIGLSFEWITGNGKFGFKIPIYYGMNKHGIYIDPMLKLYPRGQGAFKYAIGPQVVLGSQNIVIDEIYNSSTMSYDYKMARRTQFGLMFNNSINVTISHQFYIGAEFAFGAILYNDPKLDPNGLGVLLFGPVFLVNPSLSAGISTGFRF